MEQNGKILIVDDEQINLDFFEVMLSKLGFVVERAADGEEALERVWETRPDLIILDNVMPRMSGWEVTRWLKESDEYAECRDIPIIMFSALDDVQDKIQGFELGVEDYITKPFNFSEVLARIKAVLRHREMAEQVVRREHRMELVERLNKSLLHFTDRMREPMEELLNQTEELQVSNADDVQTFVSRVASYCRTTLDALDDLQEEIQELRQRGDQLKEDELTVEALDQKYRERFETVKPSRSE